MREVNRYPYVHADSTLAYWRVRYEPKTFRFEMPDGTPSLTISPILYGLPDVLASDGVVFLVEGEKDADNLKEAGLTATTVGAATQWTTTDTTPLRDVYEVIILPDADITGRKFAELAANDLAPFTRVRIMDIGVGLTEGEDVTDWMDAGGSGFKLLNMRNNYNIHEKSWTPPPREKLRGTLRDPLRSASPGLPYAASDIIYALGGRMLTSGSGVAYCPAHADEGSHNMGLSISEFEIDRSFAYCHSDCQFRDIAEAVRKVMAA